MKTVIDMYLAIKCYMNVCEIGHSRRMGVVIPNKVARLVTLWFIYFMNCYLCSTVQIIAGAELAYNEKQTNFGVLHKAFLVVFGIAVDCGFAE
ncbi:hypothetical protein L596_017508 [Steinernema carpocapsae]|nr:hypothetical protein L596_017508 [Steinernema carpocapsae]